MGSNDVPPAHCPSWVVPTSTALLGIGVLFWDATYILMTRRALATKTYGMPLLALAFNVSWELVYAFYVSEMILEKLGFAFWLLLDIGLIYTTVRFGPEAWRHTNPWVGRNIGWLFALMTAVGCVGHYAFAAWWMSEPHRGSGDKTGKFWAGQDAYDATEVAFWSAAVCQLAGSAGSLAMLITRGHSGGTSYLIWLCRALGTLIGLVFANVFLWWFWPEAHGFVFSPFAVFLWGTSLVCDIMYPFVLWQVRRSEVLLPDGTLAMSSAGQATLAAPGNHEKKKQ
ncbi:hypothetical protein B0T13DRAFT_400707 [Neurospora crassa]|nr:hypothetical protein B0T13DRAFT_400707 [Neurospora crassa]